MFIEVTVRGVAVVRDEDPFTVWSNRIRRVERMAELDRQAAAFLALSPKPATTDPVITPPLGERNTRSIPQDVKVAVAARDGGRCRECNSAEDIQFDHVIPWSRGGANTVANVQLLCGPCNRKKRDKVSS